ncbi:YadA-like family protein [Bartonella sp. AR 15-3]|uniref:YadA-like family protein n=1 Tax=Bartonella sp. AR 15-3 TaxID=545617 RepID=UPI0009D13931|nr:YadA-like family protein [Bartonella sp. AR 15-3]OPB31193.1 YadA-like C-terminal region [Bartonella sp. AR 15-3]
MQTGGTEVSLLNKDGSRRVLSGLADGDLSEGSTEAVTGSQLFKVDSDLKATKDTVTEISTTVDGLSSGLTEVKTHVTQVEGDLKGVTANVSKITENSSRYLGGGANILEGQAPTYKVQGSQHNDVGSAFVGIDAALTDIYKELSGEGGSEGVGLVQQDTGTGHITIGSKAEGTEINISNKDGDGRILSGLSDGKIVTGSREAVTGSQLYETNSKVASYLGGGAEYKEGVWIDPTFTLNVVQEDGSTQEQEYKNVADALKDVSTSFTNIENVFENGIVQQEESEDESGRITIGLQTGGTEVSLLNKDGSRRVLSGLADGDLSEGSTEAVTGSQLFKVDSDLKATKDTVTEISTTVDGLSSGLTEVKTHVTQVEGDLKGVTANVSKITENSSRYLGGGANILEGQAPTYKVQGSQHNDVGSAFVGIDAALTDIYKELSGEGGSEGVGLVQQDTGTGHITIGSKAEGTEINISNKDGDGRILSGLSDGKIVTGSREAVTGSQLYETNSKVASYLGGGAEYKEGVWIDPTFTLNVVQEDGSTQEQEYKNVADALKDVSTSFTNIENVFENGIVQQEESEDESGRITIGLQTGGTEVSLLNKDGSRRVLSGLADGDLSEGSTEAVTGSQLFKVDSDLKATKDTVTEISTTVDGLSTSMTAVQGNVSKIAENASQYLGGGADVFEGTAPIYQVQGEDYRNVGEAFASVDGSLSDIYQELSGVGSKSLVQQEASENGDGRITIGLQTGGTEVSLLNKDGSRRVLSGLADGDLSEGSTEAVTGSQLFKVDSDLKATKDTVTEISTTVDGLSTSMTAVQGDVSKIAKNTSKYLGGGANILDRTAPTYQVQGKDYQNVGSAFAGVDDSLSDIYQELSGVGSKSLVQQEASENGDGRITIGAQVGGTEISLANKDGEGRILSGLKDGALSATSNEAVTGKQLYEVDSKFTASVDELSTSMTAVQGDVSKIAENASQYLGGGADIFEGTAPTYQVQGKDYQNVGSAFAGVDDSLSDIYQELSGVGSKSLVQQEASENGDGRITIGAQVGGTEISLTNKDGEGRTLSGLKDGALSATSNEAVTGKQLYEVDSKFTASVDELSTSMTAVQGDVSKIAENASQYLGGGADIFEGTAPIYQVQGEDYRNVGEAFASVDGSLSDIYQELSGVGSKSLVQQEASENGDGRITIGAQVGGTEISLANKDGEGRTLSGLKDGALSATSNEAVTGKQLYEVDSKFTASVDELSTSMTAVQGDVSKIAENASQYLGGGADIFEGTAPIYQVQGEDYRNVGEAFASVDGSLSDIYQELSGVGSKSLVQQEASENGDGRITIGAQVGGTEISLANKDGEGRTLSGLKDGALSATSNEAVTGKQLYEVDSKFTASVDELSTSMTAVQGDVSKIAENASQYLGGGADVFHGTAPTYQVQGEDYRNVGEAFASVDGSLSDIYQELSGVGSKSLVQQEASENGDGRITIGAKVGGTEISLANKDGEGRILSGLKDGALSATSNEAVTGKQLYEVDSKFTASVDELSTSMTAVQGDVSKIAENASQYLGGGADVFHGTAPTYQVQGEFYNTVGSTFAGIDRTLTQLLNDTSENSENLQNSLLWDEEEGAFVALHGEKGKEKVKSKLKFLIDGDIAEGSTEAVTGSQLYETNTKLAEYFGGGAKYGANGWTAPKFEVVQLNSGSKSGQKNYNKYDTVAGAFGGVNDNMEDLNDRLNKVKEQTEQIEQNGLQWNQSKGAYDASRKDKEGNSDSSRITGVKDGEISKGSSDVVTGNQLWETNNKVKALEDKVDDFENSVGQMAEGAVQYDKDSEGKKTNKITLAGGDADKPVVIDNIGDGKVEKGSKEAVNGGQLYEKMTIVLNDAKKYTDEQMKQAVSEAKEYTDMKFDSLNYNIEGVKQEARQAAAIGIAAANLRYNETPGKLSVAISSGLWRNQSAFAFGAGYTSESGDIRSSISVTTAGKHFGVGGGIHFTLN